MPVELAESDSMTIELCHSLAVASGLAYYGIHGRTCRGTDDFTTDHGQIWYYDDYCTYDCPGDDEAWCGSQWGDFTMFQVEPAEALAEHLSCKWGLAGDPEWEPPWKLGCLAPPDCSSAALPESWPLAATGEASRWGRGRFGFKGPATSRHRGCLQGQRKLRVAVRACIVYSLPLAGSGNGSLTLPRNHALLTFCLKAIIWAKLAARSHVSYAHCSSSLTVACADGLHPRLYAGCWVQGWVL